MKNINLKEIFKPNPYNVDMNALKIGDIVIVGILGIMVLTEKCEDPEPSPFHGTKLFKMKKLFGANDHQWILYSNSFTDKTEYIKMATDQDIIDQMVDLTCRYNLSEKTRFAINKDKDGGINLAQDDHFIWLDDTEARKLKNLLNRFLD